MFSRGGQSEQIRDQIIAVFITTIKLDKLIIMTNKQTVILRKNRLRSIKLYSPLLAPVRDAALQEAAYRLLQAALPGHWVLHLRQWDDGGSDCLLEIVDEGQPLDGCCAWIRLLAVNGVRWNRQGQHRCGTVQRPVPYRSAALPYPVFLCLADVASNELFFLSKDAYLQAHFEEYLEKGRLRYRFDRQQDLLTFPTGHVALGTHLLAWQEKQELENLLTLTLTALDLPGVSSPPDVCIPALLDNVLQLLHGPLAYWSLTNRPVYYYLHALSRRLQPLYASTETLPSTGQPYRPYSFLTEPMKNLYLWDNTNLTKMNRPC